MPQQDFDKLILGHIQMLFSQKQRRSHCSKIAIMMRMVLKNMLQLITDKHHATKSFGLVGSASHKGFRDVERQKECSENLAIAVVNS